LPTGSKVPIMSNHPHFLGHRKRLKDRLAKEPTLLQDYEVLELMLGYAIPRRDTKPLAKELLNRFETLSGVLSARDEELGQVPGFGKGLATYWVLLREFWARFHTGPLRRREVLDGPEKVAQLARSRIGRSEIEEFWLALVDNKNRLIGFERVSTGTVDQTPVYAREILHLALRHRASGVILVHNHPGGDPAPSSQDIALTERLRSTAAELGLRVLDHLVVAENEFFSFQAHGMIG
jgi:DNA repair protein RadC